MDLTGPLHDLWTFTDDRMYMLLAVARSKENEGVRATAQPVMRKLVENADEMSDKYRQLEHATSRFSDEYRLYATVNGRNARDALYFFHKESLDWLREDDMNDTLTKHKRVDHEWKSILHQPRCRDEKRFLWDVDEPSVDARVRMEDLLDGHTILTQETPNGWHIVTEPFNFTELDIPSDIEVERKNDGMVFLGFL